MTARKIDINGFISIDANPISRVGVFPYLGRSIGAEDPDKIYQVYRPAEELANQETINSFKLLPIVDDHDMLGPSSEGYLPAEKKGTHGTIGEAVEFRDNVLYANLKIFSETLANLITRGKKDLSIGYRCSYEKKAGTFAGKAYDFIQRSLRGNHIALVDRARCDVAVLDQSEFTFDHLDLLTEKEPEMSKEAMDAIEKLTQTVESVVKRLNAKDEAEKKAEEEKKAADEAAAAEAEKKKAEDEAAEKAKGDEGKTEDKKAMDAMDAALKETQKELKDTKDAMEAFKKDGMKSLLAEVSRRDALAGQISKVVGAFDHSAMTEMEVAKYGVEKLGIKCEAGHEKAALDGFIKARESASQTSVALDSAASGKSGTPAGEVTDYLNNMKKA